MDKNILSEFFGLGFTPLPLLWDTQNKVAVKYPEHDTNVVNINQAYIDLLTSNGFKDFNAVALKMIPPYGFIDFDLKNGGNQDAFNIWLNSIKSINESILKKVCIEKTRNGGYHVYIKFEQLSHKIPVARTESGAELISVYTGGLLCFCSPSPGYELIHNSFDDVEFLTRDEFDLLVSAAAVFNEDKEHIVGQNKVAVIEYPTEYENICLQFDNKISNETFEVLLNSIGLVAIQNKFKNKKWVPFLRDGSQAMYSAKVYFHSKRLLIFSASMADFPTWHDSAKSGDNTWSLSPSKIVFYKNKKNWHSTIEEIQMIADSAGIDLIQHTPVTQQQILPADRLKFPFDVFPERIRNYISFQSIQHEYLAGFIIASLSTCLGNSVVLEAKDGYFVKPIFYIAVVAPPGASKSPAMKVAFSPLEEHDQMLYDRYLAKVEEYRNKLAAYKRDKNANEEPQKPDFPQTLIKDSTIEMVIKILSANLTGCCVVADELSGFLKRMNQYKAGDEVQKWLELWSGSPILLQRISRDENKVQEPFCTVAGGIQPGVLESLSKEENEHNGFFHRWLFVYPEPQAKTGWHVPPPPQLVKNDFYNVFAELLHLRYSDKRTYRLSEEANNMYAEWFEYKNAKYNKSNSEHVKGIIAKYQDYCLRFATLIQVIEDGLNRSGKVTVLSLEKAIRLTEYFLGNMHKAIKLLVPETPIDKLSAHHKKFYSELPESFSLKTATHIAEQNNITIGACKMFLKRGINKIFNQTGVGEYSKMY